MDGVGATNKSACIARVILELVSAGSRTSTVVIACACAPDKVSRIVKRTSQVPGPVRSKSFRHDPEADSLFPSDTLANSQEYSYGQPTVSVKPKKVYVRSVGFGNRESGVDLEH